MTKIEQIYRSFINVGFARTFEVQAVGSAIAMMHLMSRGSDPQPDLIELERCESKQVAERASPKQSPPLICASGVTEARVFKFGFGLARGSLGYTIGDQAGEEITIPRGYKLTIVLTNEGELTVRREPSAR